jgi:hypothetical protein
MLVSLTTEGDDLIVEVTDDETTVGVWGEGACLGLV